MARIFRPLGSRVPASPCKNIVSLQLAQIPTVVHSQLPHCKNPLERCMCRLNKTKDGEASTAIHSIGRSLRQNKKKYIQACVTEYEKPRYPICVLFGKIHVDARVNVLHLIFCELSVSSSIIYQPDYLSPKIDN